MREATVRVVLAWSWVGTISMGNWLKIWILIRCFKSSTDRGKDSRQSYWSQRRSTWTEQSILVAPISQQVSRFRLRTRYQCAKMQVTANRPTTMSDRVRWTYKSKSLIIQEALTSVNHKRKRTNNTGRFRTQDKHPKRISSKCTTWQFK